MEARERDELAVNTIRFLAVDAVQKANSGHPGMPMGAATMVYVLWTRFLKHNPLNPTWPDRDRFVLSAGHGSMLLYSLLYLTGYDLPEEEIRNFRQWESRTPGHPEYDPELGVETTTGPLGQGFGNAVGMAIAEAFLAAYFNRPGHSIVNHYTYVIASDGDLMEGVSAEAASLAGHLRLGKLICLYDSNDITIEGSTQLAFTEDVGRRFEAYGWQVSRVPEGNDPEAIAQALKAAQAETQRPSLIIVRTHLAYGSPGKQDDASAHGAPLGEEEVRRTKQNLGWPLEPPFYVPPEVLAYMRQARERGAAWEAKWRERFASYAAAYPHLAADWERMMNRELPEGWTAHLPSFTPAQGPMATRDASGRVLNALAPHVPYLLGGSADLAPSNKTYLEDCGDFAAENYGGRNFHFGIREHAMGAILNGLTLHRGLIAFAGTFLVFSDYMRPSIRMAAMMKIPVIYVFTHDSIGVGEDGPTHQPIEQLAALRAIPHLTVIRPADANETVMAWRVALENRDGPVALILSRQKLPILDRTHLAPAEELARGAYILAEAKGGKPEIILIATGSEIHLALEAASQLTKEGWAVRVVNMPSWELFAAQPRAYREQVLPPEVPLRLAIEAGVPLGWERYVGDRGEVLGIERFGASAPGSVVMEKFGFSAENVVARVKDLLTR